MINEPYDEADDLDADQEVPEKALTHQIDTWLAEERPERYGADDKDWMDPVIDKAAVEITQYTSVTEAVRELARRRVHQREGQATRRTNRVLRDIGQTGQLPLGWGEGGQWKEFLFDILRLPISVARERIRFGAATGEDWMAWELESARESDKRSAAEAASRDGARLLRDLMSAQGVRATEDLHQDVDGEAALATP